MFHLIEFLINKSVAVVPQNWCSDGVVHWPNYRNYERVNRMTTLRLKDSNTSDLQSEEEQVKNRPKRRPKPIHFFGDSDDKSEEEGHHNKRPRGPTKILNKPPSPVIPPPPFMPNSGIAAPPPPTLPAEEQTPSTSQVYRPTWQGERCGSESISC
ncbi:hypothetical protein QQF64_006319 [Cirrhinus molitorella]|uniref:Uncharacterized protein n=1 Tax=Cirrhinus molitorella TaxID=172907 RepID=A0ABR3MF53_9TELE